jgi:DNA repair ATPase RecN
MQTHTVTQIDIGLASWADQVAHLSTTLVEFDNHPGIEHVRRYPPTGTTAQRLSAVQSSLERLWDDLGYATATLETAQALRGRRSHLDEDRRAELTRMLNDPAGLTDTLYRMQIACTSVADFLNAVDTVNTMVAAGIALALKRLDAAGVRTPEEITDLLSISAIDPLSLTIDDVEQRVTAINDMVDRQTAELIELAALQSNWSEAVAATHARLDELKGSARHAEQARADAERVVLSALPAATDAEPEMRTELDSLTAPDPVALRSLQRRIESALELTRHHEELARGLVDRRAELKGRLKAYQAKAARLGLSADPDVLSSQRIASGLLSRRPCDLRDVTRAVNDYQQMVSGKRGAMR